MSFYHATTIRLAPGSIILPGNWGRIIRAVGERHNRWADEQVFERVRKERFVHLPSRLDACFGCPTEETLRFFASVGFRENPCPPVLYEVEKMNPDASEHRADYNLIKVNLQGETIEGQAERYWEGTFRYDLQERPGFRAEEIVTASAIRVLRELALA